MKVSIITPSYNQSKFLENTIQSVLGQGHPDIEYFIIDGGSKDGSVEVIRKYADHITWWISEPDKGQSEAINKGFRKATGDIVGWLNSDDMYAPGAISDVVSFFQKNPEIGMVYGNAVSFDQDGKPLNDLVFENLGLEGLVAFNIICQPAVFLRRELLEKAGYLDENYHLLMDHHLWLRIARITKISHIPKLWAFARHHQSAKNVALAGKFTKEAFRILDWMKDQEDLFEIIEKNKGTVMAMIHRFNGRYLLDSGQARTSLKSYMLSLSANPVIALQEWHRILYALFSMLGLQWLGKLFYIAKSKRIPASMKPIGLKNINTLYSDIEL